MNRPVDLQCSTIGSTAADPQKKLIKILERYLSKLEAGHPVDARDLIEQHPQWAESLKDLLPTLDYLNHAAANQRIDASDRQHSTPLHCKRLGDYQLLRELGRGGMGIVYEAHQTSLGRRVALKVLPFSNVLDPRQIARFENEAQAAARLHHPHIVPVFSVGCEAGVHFYAMQYIDGESLDLFIEQRRSAAAPRQSRRAQSADDLNASGSVLTLGSTGGESGLCRSSSVETRAYCRLVAKLGLQAGQALQHAHQMGIVHRDIKPSNLLLDSEGKLWVTDFGLARFQSDVGMTLSGDLIGTVRYMSPEQAAGRTSLVDEQTDVYSLGVTLYELLTLQHAFNGTNRQQLLRQIEDQDPRPPRQINPVIPIDLETIVLKAMAKPRNVRYAGAVALTDELQRFLDGKPILARRPTLADRTTKWAWRHKAMVTSAIGVLVLAIVGLATGMFLIANEQARTKLALDESRQNHRQAQENFERAEQNFQQAWQVVDRFGSRYAERLVNVPGAAELRHDLLRDTLDYYQAFIRQAGDDPALKQELAVTYYKVGRITARIGTHTDALNAYRQAQTIYSGLIAHEPGVPTHRVGLALCLNNIGLIHAESGDSQSACAVYQQALEIQRELARSHPNQPEHVCELAITSSNLGLVKSETGEAEQAEDWYRAAIESLKALVERYPDDVKYSSNLAVSYNNLGFHISQTDAVVAKQSYNAAVAIQEGLVATFPATLRYQSELALTYSNLAALQSRIGNRREAKEAYEKTVAIQERLWRMDPSVVTYRKDLAISYSNLGRIAMQLNQPLDAVGAFEKARDLLDQLLSGDSNQVRFRSALGGVHNNLGMAFERLERPQDAAAAYLVAIQHQRVALEHAPDVEHFREFLSKHYFNYGRTLRTLGRAEEAAGVALERRALWPGDPERLYWVAVELASAARQLQPAPTNDAPSGPAQQTRDEAVATLWQAVAAGFDKPNALETNRDLDAVRDHPRFVQILEHLAGATTP